MCGSTAFKTPSLLPPNTPRGRPASDRGLSWFRRRLCWSDALPSFCSTRTSYHRGRAGRLFRLYDGGKASESSPCPVPNQTGGYGRRRPRRHPTVPVHSERRHVERSRPGIAPSIPDGQRSFASKGPRYHADPLGHIRSVLVAHTAFGPSSPQGSVWRRRP